jgi:probable F420-dependent oxidoreductase
MKIRVGVQLQPQHTTWDDFEKGILAVDAAGFDTMFTWDHFYPLYGQPGDPMHPAGAPAFDLPHIGDHFEAYTLMTAMAVLTKKVEFGALVTCNSYRNPQLLADMARTIDHISHGRFILGIGSGWFERDYNEYGYEFGTAPDRLKKLDANMPIIKERLGKLTPPPVRNPMPIMIGGGGEKVTLRIVAQNADIWNGFGSPEEIGRKNGILDEWCAKVGRNPKEIERSILFGAQAGDVLSQLDAYLEAGITHFIWGCQTPFDLDIPKRIMEWRDKKG